MLVKHCQLNWLNSTMYNVQSMSHLTFILRTPKFKNKLLQTGTSQIKMSQRSYRSLQICFICAGKKRMSAVQAEVFDDLPQLRRKWESLGVHSA